MTAKKTFSPDVTHAPLRISRRGLLAAAAGAAAVACAPVRGLHAQGLLTVTATTGMIADAARSVGGDLVQVTALMGPGVDPHSYRQTRTDILALARADVVLWNGLYLEAQMEPFLHQLAAQGGAVHAVGEAVPQAQRIGHDSYEGRFDPHVWIVPDLWAHVVGAVRDALSAAAPVHADAFAANAEAHLQEITALGRYARDALATVPEPARVLVSAHDAFRYFGAAYGYEVQGIQGISTESEAGLRRIRDLVDLLVDRRITAVFVESSVSDRNVRALIEGAAARGHDVRIGGELFSDAMGPAGSYTGTYVGMIDNNVTVITRALGGRAPGAGFSGRLQTVETGA